MTNINQACDYELENAKQEHLLDSSPIYKKMCKQTQAQLGGSRTKLRNVKEKSNIDILSDEKGGSHRRFQWMTDEPKKKKQNEKLQEDEMDYVNYVSKF